jgi:hypothetical protein
MRAFGKQSTRSRVHVESSSLELSIEHHLISGLRRGSSKLSAAMARRCDHQGESVGEKTMRASEEV